jgi:hypothetical protein
VSVVPPVPAGTHPVLSAPLLSGSLLASAPIFRSDPPHDTYARPHSRGSEEAYLGCDHDSRRYVPPQASLLPFMTQDLLLKRWSCSPVGACDLALPRERLVSRRQRTQSTMHFNGSSPTATRGSCTNLRHLPGITFYLADFTSLFYSPDQKVRASRFGLRSCRDLRSRKKYEVRALWIIDDLEVGARAGGGGSAVGDVFLDLPIVTITNHNIIALRLDTVAVKARLTPKTVVYRSL